MFVNRRDVLRPETVIALPILCGFGYVRDNGGDPYLQSWLIS